MAEVKDTENVQELNLEQKVTVKNIAGWDVGFARISDGIGDVRITPNGTIRLSRNEIIAQVQNGNRLFTGIDGTGSHATLYIDDAPTRVEVSFEDEDGKTPQKVFTDSTVTTLFNKSKNFEAELKKTIRTRAEKYAIIQAITRLQLNDYHKIRMVEEYTGYRIQ